MQYILFFFYLKQGSKQIKLIQSLLDLKFILNHDV